MTRRPVKQMKEEEEEVIVTFNGKEHTLTEWTKKEVAAADDDATLNWRDVFESHKTELKTNIDEPAPTGVTLKKKTKRPLGFLPFFKHFWVPFLSAVIVGLGIGFTVLLLFSSNGKKEVANAPAAASVTEHPKEATSSGDGAADVSTLSLSVQAVQAGVLSTKAAADGFVDDLKSQGVPAVSVQDGDHFNIFIALAATEESRDQIKNMYKEKVEKPYGKEWKLMKEVKTTKATAQFLDKGRALFSGMIPLSAAAASGSAPDKKALDNIGQLLNNWSSQKVTTNDSTVDKQLISFKGMLEAAFANIKNNGDGHSGQQSLLDALGLYQEILSGLQK